MEQGKEVVQHWCRRVQVMALPNLRCCYGETLLAETRHAQVVEPNSGEELI